MISVDNEWEDTGWLLAHVTCHLHVPSWSSILINEHMDKCKNFGMLSCLHGWKTAMTFDNPSPLVQVIGHEMKSSMVPWELEVTHKQRGKMGTTCTHSFIHPSASHPSNTKPSKEFYSASGGCLTVHSCLPKNKEGLISIINLEPLIRCIVVRCKIL